MADEFKLLPTTSRHNILKNLIFYVNHNNLDNVKKLIYDHKITKEEMRYYIILYKATENNHYSIVEYLIIHHLSTEFCLLNCSAVLQEALYRGYFRIVDLFLNNGLTVKEHITKRMYNKIINLDHANVLEVLVKHGLNKDFDFVNKFEISECGKIINKLF